MARFVKRRPEVEAVRWDGARFSEPVWPGWLDTALACPAYALGAVEVAGEELIVWTIKGPMRAHPGDWLVLWARGEILAMPDWLFRATYEPAEH